MSTHIYPYRNLVFEGGGVKGVAYGGVFEVLEERQITPQIQAVAGTSAGAIAATMMALNYSAEKFLKIMMRLNFEKLEDGCELIAPFRLVRHFGWFKGNYFLKLMETYIEEKTGNARATFRDLVEKYADRHFKRLYIFGTNLTQQAVQKFSYETTPEVAVADAVRISMSIPFFFEARYYEQNGSNDAFCDGGVLNNYPIDTFDEQRPEIDPDTGQQMLHRTPNQETLGFHFVDPSQPASPINSLRSFSGGVIDALLDIQDILLKTNPGDERRSVFIDDLGVSFADFELSDKTKRALIEQGRIATTKYLDKPQPLLPPIKRLLRRV
ncbi:MAG TPA: patatin-like phospholipase family protein [Pyrinomonadaceae bacterium]